MRNLISLAKQSYKKAGVAVALAAMIAGSTGCAAKYHTIRKGQGGESQDSEAGHPGEDATSTNGNPSAQVEVVVGGSIVTKVKAGIEVIIRPSESTLDPDDKNKKDCRNPGIVKASYLPGNEGEQVSERSSDECASLEVTHTFKNPGQYEISMTVTSNENETAHSKMILEVVDSSAPDSELEGGFIVSADPLIATVDQPITFTGDCTDAKSIVWNFMDQTTGAGAKTTKAYNSPGQYEVVASCETNTGDSRKGLVTVVVLPKTPSGDSSTQTPNTDDGSGEGSSSNPNTPNSPSNPGNPGVGQPNNPNSPQDPVINNPSDDDDGKGDDGSSNPTTPNNPTKNPGDGTDNDDDKQDDTKYPSNPGQNPGQTPGQSPHQS